MEFKSKSKLQNEKRALAAAQMENERLLEAEREKERFAFVDNLVASIEDFIDAKIDGSGWVDARNDLRDAVIEAIKSVK